MGINVASAGNQLSFLVPAEYAVKLMEHARDKAAQEPDFLSTVRDQLLSNQGAYMDKLLAESLPTERINGYSVPAQLGPFLHCWGDSWDRDSSLYQRAYRTCATNDDIYLSSQQSSGIIKYRHDLYKTKGLGTTRFYRLLERHLAHPRLSHNAKKTMVTNYECDNGLLRHRGTDSKVVFCLRAYKKFEGLYDAYLTAVTLTDNREALQTTVLLAGVSYENAVRFSRHIRRRYDGSSDRPLCFRSGTSRAA